MISAFRRWLTRRGDLDVVIVAFSIALIAFIWTIYITENETERDQTIATAVKQNSNLAMAYEEHVVRTLKGLDAVIRYTRHEYRRLGRRLDLAAYIDEGVIDGKLFSILSVVDERGDIIMSSQAVPPTNYADREHFRYHQRSGGADTLYISPPVFGRVSHTWQIPMTRRITREDGSFGGVVVLSVDPAYFTDFYRKAELGGQGLVMLVGLDGMARARRVGTVVSFGNDLSGSAIMAQHRAAPVGSFVDPGGYEGVARYVSYRTLSDFPLIVAVGTAREELLADVRMHRNRDYAAAVLVSVVIGLFCFLLMAANRRQKRASRALAESEARFRATFEQAAIGIAHISLEGRYVAVNRKFCDMLGRSREELVGGSAEGAPWGAGRGDDEAAVTGELLSGRIQAHTAERRYESGGQVVWGNSTVTLVRDAAGAPMHFLRVIEDITERKRLEANLRELATTDMLTGLPNRRDFVARLEEEHARLQRFESQHAALLLLDLDYFKRINDTYGHAAGDEVLRHFAATLRGDIRRIDIVARVGGEEFAVILPGATRAAALEFAERLRVRVAEAPARHDGHEIRYTVSIGVAAMDPRDAQAGAALVRADAALYRAKQAGRNRVEAAGVS